MNYRIEEKEAFRIVGIKERFSYVDNLGQSVGEMWGRTPKETMQKISSLANMEPAGFVGVYSEMYDDNTTGGI